MAWSVTEPSVRATGSFLLADELDDTDKVLVGEVTYTFKTTPAAAGDVDIGASATASAANLVLAVMGTGTPGATTYFAGTTQPDGITAVSAAGLVTFTAKMPGTEGNALSLNGAIAGTDVTTVRFQGGVGAGVVAFLNSVIANTEIGSEVREALNTILGAHTSAAALP